MYTRLWLTIHVLNQAYEMVELRSLKGGVSLSASFDYPISFSLANVASDKIIITHSNLCAVCLMYEIYEIMESRRVKVP